MVGEHQYFQEVEEVVAEQNCLEGEEEVEEHSLWVVEVEGVLGRLLGMIVALRRKLVLPLGSLY